MKLINKKLRNKIWGDVQDKVFKHMPYDNPVRIRTRKNFGFRRNDNNLIRLKIRNQKDNIGNDLDENT